MNVKEIKKQLNTLADLDQKVKVRQKLVEKEADKINHIFGSMTDMLNDDEPDESFISNVLYDFLYEKLDMVFNHIADGFKDLNPTDVVPCKYNDFAEYQNEVNNLIEHKENVIINFYLCYVKNEQNLKYEDDMSNIREDYYYGNNLNINCTAQPDLSTLNDGHFARLNQILKDVNLKQIIR